MFSSQTIKLYTDASSELGFAVVFWKKWVAGSWHEYFTSADITLLELCPVVFATELFEKYFANHGILFMTISTNRPIMKLVRQLVLACLTFNILF